MIHTHHFALSRKTAITGKYYGMRKISIVYGIMVGYRLQNWLRAGRSGDRIPVGARFSAPVQTGPEAHPASCTMVSGSFPG